MSFFHGHKRVSHFSLLSLVLGLNSHKALVTFSAQKSHKMREGGLAGDESRLQYVFHLAHCSQCHTVCWQWSVQISQLL